MEQTVAAGRGDDSTTELDRLREQLDAQTREAENKERQLERYASDLRETFKAERARAEELRGSYVDTVRALTNALEARDAYTGAHAVRVAAYGLELARRVDPQLATNPQVEFGFLLHDVGKVAIPDGILHKADHLGDEERVLMRRHPEIGYEIVSGIESLAEAAEIVRHHHERWDGSGYPDGLAGEKIPLADRVFAVADTLDAITTDRPYRPGSSLAEARVEIRGMAGSQFDPTVVSALDEITDEVLERIRESDAT
ncbi:MAG: HD domain-containing phosphohydrolase [Thermoleophilaceae bacterium]